MTSDARWDGKQEFYFIWPKKEQLFCRIAINYTKDYHNRLLEGIKSACKMTGSKMHCVKLRLIVCFLMSYCVVRYVLIKNHKHYLSTLTSKMWFLKCKGQLYKVIQLCLNSVFFIFLFCY